MASSRRIGFYWGEEKITLVEFKKNALLQVVSLPWDTKTTVSSPFSSNLTEELQIAAILQKMLQNFRISGCPFYVSLPMKEVIVRSFILPFVKQEDIQNAVKFEARKYLPLDIQDLSYVFYVAPFADNDVKRLQIIFFAVRKESLSRYERIFKQLNAAVSYCEPCIVSLAKVLLFKKEISPTDHLAFLNLDKNSGSICFIDHGIPQFIREFSIRSPSTSEETKDSMSTLNLKIVNEVGNSFDFYARQFRGYRPDQMLVSAQAGGQDLFNVLETELKLKVRKVSPVVTMGGLSQSNDMDTINAMGVCIEPPMEPLSAFNFFESKVPKPKFDVVAILTSYQSSVIVFLFCAICLAVIHVSFQAQLKGIQERYDQLSLKVGTFNNEPVYSIQAETQQDIDKLARLKNIRTKSDVVLVLLRVAANLPRGAMLTALSVEYDQRDFNNPHVAIDMKGKVSGGDPNEQIAVVNQIFSDFKNDKELSRLINKVTLGTLDREDSNGKQVTGFKISCS